MLILSTMASTAQEDKNTFRSGTGYYLDLLGFEDGVTFWFEAGHKMKTGFSLNGRFSVANLTWDIRSGHFKGHQTIAVRQMVDIIFSRQIKAGNNYLEPGVGFKIRKETYYLPEFDYVSSGGTNVLYVHYSDVIYDLGFTLCLDYYHPFPSGFYLGARIDANILWALGFEGLTLSPAFGFRF